MLYDKFTVSQLKILKKYNIIYTSSKKASFFINKNWKQMNEWWNDKRVKSAREKFLEILLSIIIILTMKF